MKLFSVGDGGDVAGSGEVVRDCGGSMADDGAWDPQNSAARTRAVRSKAMKAQYDFTGGKRGPVLKTPAGKTRITIRIDDDLLQWFRKQVHEAGGGSYQTLINAALREHVSTKREPLEATLRRVLREELPRDLKRTANR